MLDPVLAAALIVVAIGVGFVVGRLTGPKHAVTTASPNLGVEFENVANRVLSQLSTQMTASTKRDVSAILDPLRDRIVEFQKKVEDTYAAENREIGVLRAEIDKVVNASTALGNQADGLSKALRGDVQKQGKWGELVLERILEAAALKKDREYTTQGQGLKLRSEEDRIQRPDVIVWLPDGKCVVVDSKVSLKAYDEFYSAPDDNAKAQAKARFLDSVRTHVTGLANRSYQHNDKLLAHEFVLMFFPVESALALAMNEDKDLCSFAWTKGVAIVSPSTLLMTLRTVSAIWKYENQNENAVGIAKAAGRLYDQLALGLTTFKGVGEALDRASDAHAKAMKQLYEGRGNAIGRAERMKKLGVTTKKAIPAYGDLLEADLDDDEDDEAGTVK